MRRACGGEVPAALAAETVAAFIEPFECIVRDATPDRRYTGAVVRQPLDVTGFAALVGLGDFVAALVMRAVAGTVPVAVALLGVGDHSLIAMGGAPFGHDLPDALRCGTGGRDDVLHMRATITAAHAPCDAETRCRTMRHDRRLDLFQRRIFHARLVAVLNDRNQQANPVIDFVE